MFNDLGTDIPGDKSMLDTLAYGSMPARRTQCSIRAGPISGMPHTARQECDNINVHTPPPLLSSDVLNDKLAGFLPTTCCCGHTAMEAHQCLLKVLALGGLAKHSTQRIFRYGVHIGLG